MPLADKVKFGMVTNSGMAGGKKDVVVSSTVSVDGFGQITGGSGGTSLSATPVASSGFEAIPTSID